MSDTHMKKHITCPACLALLLLISAGCATGPKPPVPRTAQSLTVMTYNLKFASNTPPNAWPARRPIMRDAIRSVAPDLFGTQEGLYTQLKELAADLPEYQWIGTGRDGGSRGEFMAIFYRADRLEPLEYDHFWLSDTPDVIASSTWGNVCRRMCTWVRFRDRRSNQEFYFLNTHLDHQVQPAREQAAALICKRADALKTTLPVLLVGDFNASAGKNPAYDIIINAGFTDTWLTAAQRLGNDHGTIHDWKGPAQAKERIDWIVARGPVTVDATQIITYSRDAQYPSDHFPVVTWLRLPAKP